MGKKGDETRKMIRKRAAGLFAQKGFKGVTMNDICQVTGLSRGGLYRHYDSTRQIFSEIVDELMQARKIASERKEILTAAQNSADEIIAAAAAAAIAWVLVRRADRESSLLSAFLEVLQEAAAEPHCIVSPNNKSHNMGS